MDGGGGGGGGEGGDGGDGGGGGERELHTATAQLTALPPPPLPSTARADREIGVESWGETCHMSSPSGAV